MTRRYVVVVATQGGRDAPPNDMQIVDAYNCVEAAKQFMLETIGRYGCHEVGVLYCRPATMRCLAQAAQIVADEQLRRMAAIGSVA